MVKMAKSVAQQSAHSNSGNHASEDFILFSDALDKETNFLRLIAAFSRQAKREVHSIGGATYSVGQEYKNGHFWVGRTNFDSVTDNEILVINEGYQDPQATLRFLAFIAKHFDQQPIRAYFFHSNGGAKIDLLKDAGIEDNLQSINAETGNLALVFHNARIERHLRHMSIDKKVDLRKRGHYHPHEVGLFYNRTFLKALKNPAMLNGLTL